MDVWFMDNFSISPHSQRGSRGLSRSGAPLLRCTPFLFLWPLGKIHLLVQSFDCSTIYFSKRKRAFFFLWAHQHEKEKKKTHLSFLGKPFCFYISTLRPLSCNRQTGGTLRARKFSDITVKTTARDTKSQIIHQKSFKRC